MNGQEILKTQYFENNKSKFVLTGIPGCKLAFLTIFFAIPVLTLAAETSALIFRIPAESEASEWLFYGLYNLIVVLATLTYTGKTGEVSFICLHCANYRQNFCHCGKEFPEKLAMYC